MTQMHNLNLDSFNMLIDKDHILNMYFTNHHSYSCNHFKL